MSKKTETNNDNSDWMTTKEAAEYLRMFRKNGEPDGFRVRNLVHAGRLPFYKPFGRLLFCKKELEVLVRKTRDGGWLCP